MKWQPELLKDGKQEYSRIKGAYINSSLKIPKNIEIINFIIEGFDEMSQAMGQVKKRKKVGFLSCRMGSLKPLR